MLLVRVKNEATVCTHQLFSSIGVRSIDSSNLYTLSQIVIVTIGQPDCTKAKVNKMTIDRIILL